MERLDDATIRRALADLPGWEFHDGMLQRSLEFRDFREAFGFMTTCALIAEAMDHHPDWTNVHRRVEIRLWTHAVGGVTGRDLRLAAEISARVPA